MGREQNQIWLHTTLGISTAASDRRSQAHDWTYIHKVFLALISIALLALSSRL
jgi:hypothetical protein